MGGVVGQDDALRCGVVQRERGSEADRVALATGGWSGRR
jgi:glycine/D-amino acid oxidase-like deaminating enzyme